MKTKTLLISVLTLCTLFLSSCFKDPCENVRCENGYCIDGSCDCNTGYTGSSCQTYIGGGGSGGGGTGGGTGGGGTGGGTCNYTSYSGPQSCSAPGGIAVSNSSCCPAGYPYYCPNSGYCYETCAGAAASGCGNIVYGTGQTGGGGGGGGGSTCSIAGTWIRTSSSNNCDGLRISVSGSTGTITYSPSSCCFNTGQQKWKNINASNCTADDMVLNSFDCEFIRYDEEQFYFNGQNELTIDGISYRRQ